MGEKTIPDAPERVVAGLVETNALRILALALATHRDGDVFIEHELRADGVCPTCSVAAYLNRTADALDALREAVKGCGRYSESLITGAHWDCGDKIARSNPLLCDTCYAKRDAAIARLLGTTDNGGVGG